MQVWEDTDEDGERGALLRKSAVRTQQTARLKRRNTIVLLPPPPMVTDLKQQQRIIEQQKRQTTKLITDQRALLRQELSNLDHEIAQMQSQRSSVAADLSRLG